MPDYHLEKNQLIKPIGKAEIFPSANEKTAIQKGLVNGRVVKVEVGLGLGKSSTQKMQKTVKEAFKKSSLALQKLELASNKPTPLIITQAGVISSSDLPLKKGEIRLTFEGEYEPTPPLSAREIKAYSPNYFTKAIQKIYALMKEVFSLKPFFDERRTTISLTAEYLATEGSQTSTAPRIVEKTIESGEVELKLQPQAPTNFLEAHHTYANRSFSTPIYHLRLAYKLKRLQPGECIITSMSIDHHAMVGMIVKEAEPSKNFSFHLANSGAGINFHRRNFNAEGEFVFQKNYVVDNIPEKTLGSFLIQFGKIKNQDAVYPNSFNAIDKLYENLKKLGLSQTIQNPTYWGKPQVGQSCVGGAELVLLQANLAPESFQKLESQLKVHAAFKNYKKIMKGFDTSYALKMNTIETVKILKRGELNKEMKASLDAIEEKVQKRINRREALKLSKRLKKEIFENYARIDPHSTKPIDQLKLTCFFIADNQPEKAHEILAKLYALPSPAQPSQEEAELAKVLVTLFQAEKGIPADLTNLYFGAARLLQRRRIPIQERDIYSNYNRNYTRKLFPHSPWASRL